MPRGAWRGSGSRPCRCRPTRRSGAARREPSHGRSRTSSTKMVGASSPAGTAVVIMNDVTPEPLPKCLSPRDAVARAGDGAVAASSGSASDLVRAMSPPLPGSDVIVPHCSPVGGAWRRRPRAARSTPSRLGSGWASQKASTAGCIDGDERHRRVGRAPASAAPRRSAASSRRRSATGPPPSSGTATSRKPGVVEPVEVVRRRGARRAWRSARVRSPLAGDDVDLTRQARPRHVHLTRPPSRSLCRRRPATSAATTAAAADERHRDARCQSRTTCCR